MPGTWTVRVHHRLVGSGVAAGPWEEVNGTLVCWRGLDRSGCVLTRVGLRTIRKGVGLGNPGQGPRESDSGQHSASVASLPTCLGLQLPGFHLSLTLLVLAALTLPLPSLAATPLCTAHCMEHSPRLAPLARSAFFPSLPLKMALCGPLPGVFSTVFLCGAMQGPPICLTSIYSFPSYLRCFLLQEAFPDSPPLFYFHRQFAAPCCKFP